MPGALVKTPSPNYADGLTGQSLGAPDLASAIAQHERYCSSLEQLGFALILLPSDDLPDSCFVEDMAVVGAVKDGCGFVLSARSSVRAREQPPVLSALAEALPSFRQHRIEPPGCLDGGDVLRMGQRWFVGLTARTNQAAFEQFQRTVEQYGFEAFAIEVQEMLHLKSGVSRLDDQTVLAIPPLAAVFADFGFAVIEVNPKDWHGANVLAVGRQVLLPSGHPHVVQSLLKHSFHPLEVDLSEFKKQDGGASCLSILLP